MVNKRLYRPFPALSKDAYPPKIMNENSKLPSRFRGRKKGVTDSFRAAHSYALLQGAGRCDKHAIMSESIVTVDIGGTHARFAIAQVADGRCVGLGEAVVQRIADHAGFEQAWRDFEQRQGGALPRALAMAVAAPVGGEIIDFTNNEWTIRPALIGERLNVAPPVIVNDFEAVGHAVVQVEARCFERLAGPDAPLPICGTISVVGPGTGLGVAHVWRDGADYRVQATQGGHIDFAPLDDFEDALLARLRTRHSRVSAERVVSGPGIVDIYETLADREGRAVASLGDRAIWTRALNGEDELAAAAVDRFCLSLGSVAGDLALAHGASGVVIAGGLGLRIRDRLVRSGFSERFAAKGRFRDYMAAIPVRLITHPQPGLLGAAAAFARLHD
jgi:glucokinase